MRVCVCACACVRVCVCVCVGCVGCACDFHSKHMHNTSHAFLYVWLVDVTHLVN